MKGGIAMKPLIIPVSKDKDKNTVTLDYTKFCELIESVYENGVKDGMEKSTLSIPTKPNGPITTEPIWKYPYTGDPISGTTPLTNVTPQVQRTLKSNSESPYMIYGKNSGNITCEKSFENILQDLKDGKNPTRD